VWGLILSVVSALAYPDWLEELVDRLLALGAMAQRPTQVSVNHYVPHPEPYRLVVRTPLQPILGCVPSICSPLML
jgi:hypothetical protein